MLNKFNFLLNRKDIFSSSVVENILKEREIKNEKRVALVRFLLASTVVLDILAYLDIISFNQPTTFSAVAINVFMFIYSSAIIMLLFLKNHHSNYLKFYIISLDYLYIALSFIYITPLTDNTNTLVWYAFAGTIIFFLINLLRYSKSGTIFTAILSLITYYSVTFHFGVPFEIILNISIPFSLILIIGYSITTSNKEMMIEANTKKMMERYLSPQLVDELYRKDASLEPGGKTQEVTILFSDIKSFTTFSENNDANDVVLLLNNYLSKMTDIIFKYQGTIDKFVGDAIMTVFGAPIKQNDDALRAVKTAIDMSKAVSEFSKEYKFLDELFEIGIGIHTGNVITGNIGSDKRLDYTVIGDNVNLASRIEGLTRFYHCPILISETTYNELKKENQDDLFYIREVDKVIVKGRSDHISVYEVIFFSNNHEKTQAKKAIDDFETALSLYKNLEFHEAAEKFKLIECDKLSKIYYNRCIEFIKNPPEENWDGIFTMNKK